MSNVSEWSTTAASNNSASPNGAPEGMAPSGVNDVIRENMAAVSKVYKDQQGGLVTTGSANTYLLTTNNVHTTLADIGLTVVRINATNTGASTLNIDSMGAKSINFNGYGLSAGMLLANSLYAVAYNSTNDVFDLVGLQSGMVLLSRQTASASANIDFTANIGSAFDSYEIHIDHAKLSSDSQDLYMRTSTNGGSSYDTGASNYSYNYTANTAGAISGNSTITGNNINVNVSALGNDTNEFFSAKIRIIKPSATDQTAMFVEGYGFNPSGDQLSWHGFAKRLSAADVDAIRFIPSSGNITSGIFKLYGIR